MVNYQAFSRRDLLDSAPARKLMGIGADHMRETRGQAVRRVVGDLLSAGGYGNVCVINDEAHHCYDPDAMSDGPVGAEDEQAAVWFNTLRTLRDVGALGKVGEYGQESAVFDFSATPLWINMAARAEPAQFQWVASEFGLMESIESGLVKVPRVPIDDDSSRDETVWRRLYQNTEPQAAETVGRAAGTVERGFGGGGCGLETDVRGLAGWRPADPAGVDHRG